MGCQAHKAHAPSETAKAPAQANGTLLTGPKAHFARAGGKDGQLSGRKGPHGAGEAFPPPRPASAEGEAGRAAEEHQDDTPTGDGQQDRKFTTAPSMDSSLHKSSLSGATRSASAYSSFNMSMSTTPASARTSESRQTRTSWAMGHVQEESGSPMATPSALTARRLVTEQALPEVTPRVHCPDSLWLVAPSRPHLQGVYCRLPDALANGEPIWRQADGEGWLFSCSTGFWMVADAREKVERNLAQLRTVDRHYAKLPHECPRWMYGEDSRTWVTDSEQLVFITPDRERALFAVKYQGEMAAGRAAEAARRALTAPESLWLAAPPKPFLQGEYRKVEGWMEDDMPVWRHVTGEGCLMSSSNHWVICEGIVEDVRRRAQIRSSQPHNDQWPEEVNMWKYSNPMRGWTTDYVRAICMSTDRSAAERSQANYMYVQEDDALDIDLKVDFDDQKEEAEEDQLSERGCHRSMI
mmetsp:Transcript_69723/g.204064  ORF Transcript_69723/g.204064 Transcript_69723/m.204064 type:complete len:467 (-) Transcript_69723:39-1439(-)